MEHTSIGSLTSEISAVASVRRLGRVQEVASGTLLVAGLSDEAALGDLVEISCHSGETLTGEILQLSHGSLVVLPNGPLEGVSIGDRVVLLGGARIAPDTSWVGRVIDPFGHPIDGNPMLRGTQNKKLRADPPKATERRGFGRRLETGLSVFNTLLPIARGQRIGLFAGSGVAKSTLLSQLARGLEADVVVIALIGERGREVREFVDRVLGPEGMARSIVVAATSDQSPVVRRRCGWTAVAVAEYFRDLGYHVLLMADSITRFAEAHREVALASGEEASLRGFPPSTTHTIMSLCERAGPGQGHAGDITAVFSVLVAASDMDEPIADILRGVLDGHIVLDRSIAERGRFPAIDLLRSVSRSLPDAASISENATIANVRQTMGLYEKSEMMIKAGLYVHGTDAQLDRAIALWPKIDEFLTTIEPENSKQSFARLAEVLASESPKESA